MIRVGITGSIGMGKSMTAGLFASLGIPVHGSDEAVHELLGPRGDAVADIRAVCPAAYDTRRRCIDRAMLGRHVFADPALRRKVEQIVHPLVQDTQKRFEQRHRRMGSSVICFDIPLLFETGAQARLDHVVAVWAPPFLQRQRALARPAMTRERFDRIRTAQWPDGLKKRLAHSVLATGLGRGHSMRCVKKLVKDLRSRHARNRS